VDLLISQSEFKKKKKKIKKYLRQITKTPWQEIFRDTVGQLEDGACINSRGSYLDVSHKKGLPRNSH
jgi:dihydroxy-acid dehydratase